MRRAQPVTLNTAQCKQLDRYARGRQVAVRLALRARIVLLAAHGLENKQIAAQLGVSRQLVARWRTRFLESGIAGIAKDAPRPGRTPAVSKQKVQQIIHKTTREKPSNATHWSRRTMAAAAGVSASTVGRIWRAHGLKPHRVKTFKLSNDRVSPRNSTTSSDSISIRLSMLWFSRSMRSPKSKPSIAPNPACRSKRDAAKR